MSKNKKIKILNEKVPFLFIVILASVLFMANLVLFEDHVKKGWVLGVGKKVGEKVIPGQAKKLDNINPNNLKAKNHVEKVKDIVNTLEDISSEEAYLGNDEVSEEISDAAEDVEDSIVDVADEIEEIEDRPAWKKFVLGPDYKNLGQLRSSLVKTDNGIRKITRTTTRVEGSESDAVLKEQLGELNQERERIMSFIKEEEESFSLLGWVVKMLTGYTSEESALVETGSEVTTETLE